MTLAQIQFYMIGSIIVVGIAVILLAIFLVIKKEYSLAGFTITITFSGLMGIYFTSLILWQYFIHCMLY